MATAREEDGSVQLTVTIPWKDINEEAERELFELAKTAVVKGFRKGKAPINKVREQTSTDDLYQKAIQKLLPKYFGDELKKEGIEPIMYPKFQPISTTEGKDWQIRAVTAEAPDIPLDGYKEKITGELRAKSLKRELSQDEKEQAILAYLSENIDFDVPKILIQEETNSRLSNLIQRLEKLGLDLDGYLRSVGKNARELREEYEREARRSLKLELLFGKIALEEKISAGEEEISQYKRAASASSQDAQRLESSHARDAIGSIIVKRKVIKSLAGLT